MTSTNTETMRLRTRTSTRKTSNESVQIESVADKPKRRKSADSSTAHTVRSTQRSKSNRNRSNSRSRTGKNSAPKLYTKKDLDHSPVKTRSRRKTAQKPPAEEPDIQPDLVQVETIKTSFANCEYDIVEKPVQPAESSANENQSSEHRFEDDELQDTKNREKNAPDVPTKNDKGCTFYNAGYLRFTTCTLVRTVLVTLMFLIVLTFLNNVYQFESVNQLGQKWPLFASVKTNIDHFVDKVSNFLIGLF